MYAELLCSVSVQGIYMKKKPTQEKDGKRL